MSISSGSDVSRTKIFHNQMPQLEALRKDAYFDQKVLEEKADQLRSGIQKAAAVDNAQRQADIIKNTSPAYVLSVRGL